MFSLSASRFSFAWLRRRIIGRVVVPCVQVPRRLGDRDDFARLRVNRSSPFASLNEGVILRQSKRLIQTRGAFGDECLISFFVLSALN